MGPRLALALATLFALGCATIRAERATEREGLLVESGFRKLAATTDAQQADLARLPSRRIAAVPGAVRRYVWADAEGCGCLYLGEQPEYDFFIRKLARELIDNDYLVTSTPGPQVSPLEEEQYERIATQAFVDPHEASIDWNHWPAVE